LETGPDNLVDLNAHRPVEILSVSEARTRLAHVLDSARGGALPIQAIRRHAGVVIDSLVAALQPLDVISPAEFQARRAA
jgi:hypothetical protein